MDSGVLFHTLYVTQFSAPKIIALWSSSSADVYLSSVLQPVTSLLCKHSGYTVSSTQTET